MSSDTRTGRSVPVIQLPPPLPGGSVQLDRFRSAVLQVQAGDPLVPAADLLTEPADVLQGLALQRLDRRVLQKEDGLDPCNRTETGSD